MMFLWCVNDELCCYGFGNGCRGSLGCNEANTFAAFLGMNRREKELVDLVIFIDGVSAFGLRAADDPIAALFCLGE